jgi:hypothetical protein
MPSIQEEEPKRTGAVSSKGTLSSGEKRRKVMSRVMMAILGGAFAAHTVYLGREWEEDELKEKRLVSAIPIAKLSSGSDVSVRESWMRLQHGGGEPRNGSETFST